MEGLIIISGIIGAGTLLYVIAGMTLDDIATVRRQRQIRLHPHAKAHRQRPFVTVIIQTSKDRAAPTRCIANIKANRYRNKRIIVAHPDEGLPERHQPKRGLIMTLRSSDILPKDALLTAVQALNDRPAHGGIELSPSIPTPTTLSDLLQNYRLILELMFAKPRRAFGLTRLDRPVLLRITHTGSLIKWRLYNILTDAIKLVLISSLGYVTYVALWLRQPQLLLTLLAGLAALLFILIWTDQRLTIKQRVSYTLLLPVSFGYFYALVWLALVKIVHTTFGRSSRVSRNVREYANS